MALVACVFFKLNTLSKPKNAIVTEIEYPQSDEISESFNSADPVFRKVECVKALWQ
jgi:hypothetical protein